MSKIIRKLSVYVTAIAFCVVLTAGFADDAYSVGEEEYDRQINNVCNEYASFVNQSDVDLCILLYQNYFKAIKAIADVDTLHGLSNFFEKFYPVLEDSKISCQLNHINKSESLRSHLYEICMRTVFQEMLLGLREITKEISSGSISGSID